MNCAMSTLGLCGQVAIVTGAASGIGRATALLLGARRVKVVVNDVAQPERVAEQIRAAGGEAIAETTVVGTHEAGRRTVAAAVAAFGRLFPLSDRRSRRNT